MQIGGFAGCHCGCERCPRSVMSQWAQLWSVVALHSLDSPKTHLPKAIDLFFLMGLGLAPDLGWTRKALRMEGQTMHGTESVSRSVDWNGGQPGLFGSLC